MPYYFKLFLHYEWDLEYKELLPTNPDQQSDIRERDPIDERIREGETQCEFCLCAPCVTSEENKQLWWPEQNAELGPLYGPTRKGYYHRFWTILLHRGVWSNPVYKERKAAALGEPNNLHVFHCRDLMPKCVLDLVRTWFPNPPDRPYMNHKWK